MKTMSFTTESMVEILPLIKDHLSQHSSVTFNVLNPDLGEGYAGNIIKIDKHAYIYRGFKAWCDLAELCMCSMSTPKESEYPLVELTFKKLPHSQSFHHDVTSQKEEKYGTDSHFFQIHKMEEPGFYYYYDQALTNAQLDKRKKILNLGINRGDEFEIIKKRLKADEYTQMELVGIDHSTSAIAFAKDQFPEKNVHFFAEDINHIDRLGLGKFDLLVSIGTLQSPSIPYKPFLMKLVQEYLSSDAALILGFPNCRWIGGEMIYGAKAPNYVMSEQTLLYNDVMFAKKYLQQKKFRVTITGKQYVFLTATKIL